ncbi:uncharacterized protein RAG0_06823 [Rhynchosporium agropyri]|uniref:Uncharacterized protein n=1 Tax=Rhynchosporium agropyri TaxID=914238 RepID=A0A1E1KIZ9_9HELO|nr:uncharacterized protein RAG0_06823 [Rhynchosporium agropyri]
MRTLKACIQFFPDQKSFTTPVGGGLAFISHHGLKRTMNRIMVIRHARTILEFDLAIAEDLFANNGLETLVCFCPHADPSALKVLASRGYVAENFMNCYARVLADDDLEMERVEGAEISRVPPERSSEFPVWCVAGCNAGGGLICFLNTLGRLVALHKDTIPTMRL